MIVGGRVLDLGTAAGVLDDAAIAVSDGVIVAVAGRADVEDAWVRPVSPVEVGRTRRPLPRSWAPICSRGGEGREVQLRRDPHRQSSVLPTDFHSLDRGVGDLTPHRSRAERVGLETRPQPAPRPPGPPLRATRRPGRDVAMTGDGPDDQRELTPLAAARRAPDDPLEQVA